METERAMLVRQVLAGVALLDDLADGGSDGAAAGALRVLERLTAADLEAVAASLAILVDGARRLAPPAEDGNLG